MLEEHFAIGAEWVAFKAKVQETNENVIVKRYVSPDATRNKVRDS
jgi:hypothetical protein